MKKLLLILLILLSITINSISREVIPKKCLRKIDVHNVEILDTVFFEDLFKFLSSDSIMNIYDTEFSETKYFRNIINDPNLYMTINIGNRPTILDKYIKINYKLYRESLNEALDSNIVTINLIYTKEKDYDYKSIFKGHNIYFSSLFNNELFNKLKTNELYKPTQNIVEQYYMDLMNFSHIYESSIIPILYNTRNHKFYVEPDSTQYEVVYK